MTRRSEYDLTVGLPVAIPVPALSVIIFVHFQRTAAARNLAPGRQLGVDERKYGTSALEEPLTGRVRQTRL